MSKQTDNLLSTSWTLVRDAGNAVGDAATHNRVVTSLARNLPRVKEALSLGAGLEVARRGTRVALATARRNPVAVIAGAVALAGIGLAIAAARRRRREDASDGSSAKANQPRRLSARNMRDDSGQQKSAAASRSNASRRSKADKTAH